jgi:glycine/D-amino acid oxidase-like deaminating enzyme
VFVNTAGCDVPALADQLGMRMPVEPMRRLEHYALTTADVAGLPFIKDADHLAVRPECNAIQAGVVDWNSPAGAALSRLGANSHFINTVWPALAHRFPDFDRIRLISSWSGLYHTNRLDGNVIIGNWPGNLDNFYVACGFPATA